MPAGSVGGGLVGGPEVAGGPADGVAEGGATGVPSGLDEGPGLTGSVVAGGLVTGVGDGATALGVGVAGVEPQAAKRHTARHVQIAWRGLARGPRRAW